jgi:hypothetical protein
MFLPLAALLLLDPRPSLEEVERLPPVPAIHLTIQMQYEYLAMLQRMRPMAPPWSEDNIDGAICECRYLLLTYSRMAAARDTSRSASDRRDMLHEIRERVSNRAWIIGDWPAPIPVHRVPRADR